MNQFAKTKALAVPVKPGATVDDLFAAGVGTTASTLETIRETHQRYGYLLDPHTAVGVRVARDHMSPDSPMICLATAHPAKFNQAILDATGADLAHHPTLDALVDAPTRREVLPANENAVRDYIAKHVS